MALAYRATTLSDAANDTLVGILVGTGIPGVIAGTIGCLLAGSFDGEVKPTGKTDGEFLVEAPGFVPKKVGTCDFCSNNDTPYLARLQPLGSAAPDDEAALAAAVSPPPTRPLPAAAPRRPEAAPGEAGRSESSKGELEAAARLAAAEATTRPGGLGVGAAVAPPEPASHGPDHEAVATPPVEPRAAPPAAASTFSAAITPFARGAPQPTAFALVIGVERYRDLPAPTGARGDAERFGKLATETLGVPERHLRVALDDRASRSDLEKHLDWLERNVPKGGRIYLFFAGHGAPDPASGSSYLLPYDADPASLEGTALKLSELTARLGKSKAREVVVFLDSCFSGTGGRSVLAAGVRPLVPVQKLAPAPRVSIFAAVTGAQISGADRTGAGLFSQFLLEALGSGKADINGDAQITLKELETWVSPRVEREAKLDNRDQLPSLLVGKGVDADSVTVSTGTGG